MADYRPEKARLARNSTRALRELLLGYRTLLEDAVRGEGLSLAQLRLLNVIREHRDVSGAMIARICHVTPQTLQAMLIRAERQHWITREASASNHRIVTASLTEKGEALLERGLAAAADIEAKMWYGVSEQQLENMNLTLEMGIANLLGAGQREKHAPKRAGG